MQQLNPYAEAGFSLSTNHLKHHPFLVVVSVWPPKKPASCNAQIICVSSISSAVTVGCHYDDEK